MKFVTVYVGKYKSVPESKKDQEKLNKLGFRGYVFSLGDYYGLRIGAYPDNSKANHLVSLLKSYGFDSYIL